MKKNERLHYTSEICWISFFTPFHRMSSIPIPFSFYEINNTFLCFWDYSWFINKNLFPRLERLKEFSDIPQNLHSWIILSNRGFSVLHNIWFALMLLFMLRENFRWQLRFFWHSTMNTFTPWHALCSIFVYVQFSQ